MSKQAFDNIMKGLQDVLAYVQGDESAVTRIVDVDVKPVMPSTKAKKGSKVVKLVKRG